MKIIVQNLATKYQDNGTGSVLLFLHGWQDDLHTFDALVSDLSSIHRIVRLDLPGFGMTERPKQPWGVDEYVQFVADFIKKLDIHVDVLVGHSFGGRIVIKGVATKSFCPCKLVLIGSAGIAKRRTFRNRALIFLAKIGKVIMCVPPFLYWRKKLRKRLYTAIGSDYYHTGSLKETFLKIISEDLSTYAQSITLPTLLIWGKDDTATPTSDGERFSQLIFQSELHVLPAAGHFVHKEKSQEVSKLIQEFI